MSTTTRLVLTVLCSAILSTSVRAGDVPAAPAPATTAMTQGPHGTLEVAVTTHDAGKVERGSPITYSFVLRNVGKADLTIDAKPGCGCTVVDYEKVLAPGKETKLTASVKTESFKGPITKSITVSTNDPEHAQTTLHVKADVVVPIDVQPTETVFLQGKAGEVQPTELTVSSTDGMPFDILDVQQGDTELVVDVKPAGDTATPAKERAPKVPGAPLASGASKYLVTVGLPADVEIGRTHGTFTLKTSHPKAESLPIRVNAQVRGSVDVVPERLYFASATVLSQAPQAGASAPVQPPQPQRVKLTRTDGTALKIEGVSSKDPDFEAKLRTVAEGQEYELEVKFVGKPGKGTVSTEIVVKTNEPKQPEIKIPIVGRV
jgi:hypothetical protein